LQNFYFCQMTIDRIEINLVYLIIIFSKKINSRYSAWNLKSNELQKKMNMN